MNQFIDLNDQRSPVERALCWIFRCGLLVAFGFAVFSVYMVW